MKSSIVGIACILSPLPFPSIVQSANAALAKALANPELRGSPQKGSLTVRTNSPKEFSAQIRNDVVRWRTVIEKNHITVQ